MLNVLLSLNLIHMVKLTKVSLTTKSDVNAVSESSVKMKTKLKIYKF